MKLNLLQQDIKEISADGLVLPCDGNICVIGEGLAATRRGNIEINWCILNDRHLELAKRTCRYLNLIAP